MLDKVLHNRWPRVGAALFGSLLLALAINLFIVPQHLYSSGLLGLCQVIRTLLDTKLGIRFDNFDLAGTLYLAANLPLLLAYKTMGRSFVAMLALCTVSNSVFLSIIPIPATPIIPDVLTSCLVGGILAGFSNGLVLTCGASCGGLDILGLYLSKKTKGFTVGRFSLLFNAVLYTMCLVLFSAPTAIYSAIYTVFNALFVDRVHQQNITTQVLLVIWSPSGSWGGKWTGALPIGPATGPIPGTRYRSFASACPSMRSRPCSRRSGRWTPMRSSWSRRGYIPWATSSGT